MVTSGVVVVVGAIGSVAGVVGSIADVVGSEADVVGSVVATAGLAVESVVESDSPQAAATNVNPTKNAQRAIRRAGRLLVDIATIPLLCSVSYLCGAEEGR